MGCRGVRRNRFQARSAAGALLAALVGVAVANAQGSSPRPTIATPTEDEGAASLPRRAEDQRKAAAASEVLSSFELRDRREASGIAFRHRIVDDAGRAYKMVHYDHGNGVAAADVDGDGLADLYFTNQLGGNELWRNLGGGRFENATERAGVALADRVSVAAAFGDADGDGDPDLFVTTVRMGNALFENLGGGRFRDVTEAAGVGHVGHSSGALWLDYDRDGDLDLFVTNVGVYTTEERGRGGYWVGREDAFSGHLHPERAERNLLYENLGGLRFREVSEERGLVDTGWSGDAAATDLDGDGYPELYVLNMQGDDAFWADREGRGFEDETALRFPKTPWGAMGVAVLDYDNDGRMDLYVTDMHSDMSKKVGYEEEREKADVQWDDEYLQGGADNLFGNAFHRNLGPDPETGRVRFEEASGRLGVEVYWPWGVSAGDLNADGWTDLFVTASMNFPYRYQPSSVFLNEAGRRFLDVAFVLGVEPRPGGATQTPWFDVDCSGAEREEPYCRGRSGPHTVTGTLGSRSSVLLDLEGDGDLDVVTNELNSAPQVLVSDLAERRGTNRLEIELRGTRSNRDGLGAFVRVHAGGRTLTFQHDGKSGYLAQSSLPLYVGLGEAEAVDRVEVLWPSGTEQVVAGPIPAGRRLEIVEPAAPEAP
jgi:hypothetical protein